MNQTKKIDALIIVLTAFATLLAVLTIPLLNRLSSFYGFQFSLATLIMPFSYLLFDIVSEIYNRKIAIYLLLLSIFMVILFSTTINLLLLLPIPSGWNYENYYNFIFGSSIRHSLFGPLSLILSQIINIYLITYFNQLVKGKYFCFRAIGASGVGEIIVSCSAIFIFNQYGLKTVIEIATVGYILKLIGTIVLAPFITFIVIIIKHIKNNSINK